MDAVARALADPIRRDILVMHRADLLERVRERVVPHIVEQRGPALLEAGHGLADDLLIPYSPDLEDAIIPSAETIADSVRALRS